MESTSQLLEGHSPEEKEAYIGAIASMATADRQAGESEQEYLQQLSEAAGLGEDQKDRVLEAAADTSGTQLTTYLDTLKNSELKYSLLTDLMSFAQLDHNYSEEEEGSIRKVADYLGISQQQQSVLQQVAGKAASGEISPEQGAQPNQLAGGLGQQLQSAGINGGGLLKNLIGMAAPFILGSLVSRGMSGRNSNGGGGGLLGGLGGLLGGNSGGGGLGSGMGGGGGLGSIIGMLNGGRGMGSLGGLLGKLGGGF